MPGYGGAPASSAESQLSRAIIQEETNPDPNVAKESYKALVQQFDQQRRSAAQAIFRLGECYRRLGRMEEARAQYGRIVREFVDFPELAQQSLRMLSETARQGDGAGPRVSSAPSNMLPPTDASSIAGVLPKYIPEMKALVQEQIRVREQALKVAKDRQAVGAGQMSDVADAEVQLLELKQKLLALNSAEEMAAERSRAAGGAAATTISGDVLLQRNPQLVQLESELRSTTSKIMELETEQTRDIKLLETLKRDDLEALPMDIDHDERYKAMRKAYADARASAANASDPTSAESNVAKAKQQFQDWLRDVYIPKLNVAAEHRKEKMEQLSRHAAGISEQLAKISEEMARSAARR